MEARQRLAAPGPMAVESDVRVVVRRKPTLRTILTATVIVGSLGYFVDVYDLLLFSIIRAPSLTELGVPQSQLLNVGVTILNWQMGGLLAGGILWGVLGDKRGRVSVLFGSILLYSLANIANAFVQDTTQYAALRFIAGVGLAGELGAAVTLVSEVMPKETRGYGAAIVSGAGISGAVAAGLIAAVFPWRVAFIIGGVMGLALLVARMKLVESGMFANAKNDSTAKRGDLTMLFRSRARLKSFAACILIGLPLWYVVGILLTFSPEISRALGVGGVITAGSVVLVGYAGATLGSFASGILSERLKSRRLALAIFMVATAALTAIYLLARDLALPSYYALCFGLGFGAGYWAVFMSASAEQFGTNLRATVTTSVPNIVRGGVVPMTLAFTALRAPLGLVGSAAAVGAVVFGLGALAIWGLPETYGKELDYVEE